jgi:hypothetical protein
MNDSFLASSLAPQMATVVQQTPHLLYRDRFCEIGFSHQSDHRREHAFERRQLVGNS